jgi:hypothetical protein
LIMGLERTIRALRRANLMITGGMDEQLLPLLDLPGAAPA